MLASFTFTTATSFVNDVVLAGRYAWFTDSAQAQLYRVDPATGRARLVDLTGAALTNGDGLLLAGRTLYAVQNRQNQIAVVKLDRRGTSGRVQRTITSPAFDVPSTAAAAKGYLYLPNARFGAADPGAIVYRINRVKA